MTPNSLRDNGADCLRWEFRRGFVEVVSLSSEAWIAHVDRVREAAPVREVKLTTVPLLTVGGEGTMVQVVGRERWHKFADLELDDPTNGQLLRAILAAEWPGIKFALPPAGGVARTQLQDDAIYDSSHQAGAVVPATVPTF